jgi:hypothetical protein
MNTSARNKLYRGSAGELAVMSELLWRGWNVAAPQVDVGDDIFVVEDEHGTFYRVQVKTALADEREYGVSGQFSLQRRHLERPRTPQLIPIA